MTVVLIVVCAALMLMLVERYRPGHELPSAPLWIPRVLLLNAAQAAVVFLGARTWDRWLPELRLWDASALGATGGAILGYLVLTFVYYWWHRARHESPFLWRWLHQVHHSPVRIEVAMSFYKHPLEIALNGILSSVVLYVLLGLTPAVAAIAVTMTGVAELLYHSNLRTPHWLGYVFQRPESHRRHHERNWHRCNYSDLPLWDLLFGTFDNPRASPEHCGFAAGKELQLLRMLAGRRPW